jgi:methionine sulfoxide reductase heme-binding subunit
MTEALNAALRRAPTWPVYALGLVPAAWAWYLGFTGGLGPEPISTLEQILGKYGLQFLIASLLVTPARRFLGLNLLRFRRALGLVAFAYIVQHLLVWLILDLGNLRLIGADIVKRPYVTVGMLGFLAMLPLALTSTDRAVRLLGALNWRRLHRLAYVSAAAGVAHYLMLTKGWQLEPLLYAGAVGAILALRLVPRNRQGGAPGGVGRPAARGGR